MISFYKNLNRKKVLILLLLATAISISNLFITSRISKSYKVATNALFSAEKIPKNLTGFLLYSSGYYGSAGYSCSTFSFIALEGSEINTFHVQVTQDSPEKLFLVREITRGLGSEFTKNCKI